MKETLDLKNPLDRKKITELLKEGKIGLFPTDTVWGICCRLDLEESVEKIFEIKKRELNKPFLILATGLEQIKKYADISQLNPEVTRKYWPGPLTIVLKARKQNVHSIVRAGGDTIAVRIPDYPEIVEIISGLGVPIVAPSANLSGEKTPSEYREIDSRIVNSVDFVVDGECKIKKPSTVVDFSEETVKIIREGAIKFEV